MPTCLMGPQEFDIGLQLIVAAVLTVWHQVDGAVALCLHWKHIPLVLIRPSGGHPANHLHSPVTLQQRTTPCNIDDQSLCY